MMQYEFRNEAVLEMSEKLVIAETNPLACYLVVKINYADFLLIIKLIILGDEFKLFREISFDYDSTAKPRRKIKPSQCVPRQSKN